MRLRILILAAIAMFTLASPATGATKTVRYGPYTIPAGSMENPARVSRVRLGVPRPCLGCFITSFRPALVYADGTTASMSTGPMLHHFVLTNQLRADATCGGTWLGLAGERFFASGDERTPIVFPAGYGYRVRWYDSWNSLVEVMNHAPVERTVYVQVTYTYRATWESVRHVRPVWLDIDSCGDSEYAIPAGFSDTHRDWTVNVPGAVVSAVGHVHGHGVAVEATNESQGGASICRSNASLDPMDSHRVMSMSTCTGDPIAIVRTGETVRFHSEYQSAEAAYDVMGIMLLYIRPT
jgi:hypothetical protein